MESSPEAEKIKTLQFIRQDVAIANKTYYGIGGCAQWFATPRSFREVQGCLQFAKKNKLPVSVLGTGSNSVFSDDVFEGLVISLVQLNAWFWETPDVLFAEAGVTNTELAEVCLDSGRDGASWMYRMPGQLGATVRMNARCYGGEISQITLQVLTIDTDGNLKTYNASEIFQGYKSTRLMSEPEIVVAVRVCLPKISSRTEILQHMLNCELDRHSKHHFDFPSCGSTFKNNYTIGKPSGQIFDELGLKGYKSGGAEVSQFHANFVWNYACATATDMLSVAGHMRQTALQKKGFKLELEVQPIGCFADNLYKLCGMETLGQVVNYQSAHWMGLLHHFSLPTQTKIFPVVLLSSPYIEYSRKPFAGLNSLVCELLQLTPLSVAKANPKKIFLSWRNRSTGNALQEFSLVPTAPAGRFLDNLWVYSVAEIFIANPADRKKYFEFEITPQQHWLALRFSEKRVREQGFENASEHDWPGISTFNSPESGFGLEFSYEQLAPLIAENRLAVQCMASLGNSRYFLAPHWKQQNSANETWDFARDEPVVYHDFHQPERFGTIELID